MGNGNCISLYIQHSDQLTSSTFSAPSWTSSYAGKSITDMASLSRS